MSSGYSGKLKDLREIYVPHWPVDVSLENLTKAGQYLGTESMIFISELNIPAVVVAISESKDPEGCAALIKHFVCNASLEGDKITPSSFDEIFKGKLHVVAEIFAHVVHAQYADFFEQGLAKEPSQAK
jgi:hypothetical protein